MHELSLVAELVDECERRASGRRVAAIRVRHATTIDEDILRQAFTVLTVNGPLAGVRLDTECFDVWLDCVACGFSGELDHDHVAGHVRICPACGTVSEEPRSSDLELVEVASFAH